MSLHVEANISMDIVESKTALDIGLKPNQLSRELNMLIIACAAFDASIQTAKERHPEAEADIRNIIRLLANAPDTRAVASYTFKKAWESAEGGGPKWQN